ncbi:MAG: hypothetical protein R6X32_06920 [Chloroflexota bacterium]
MIIKVVNVQKRMAMLKQVDQNNLLKRVNLLERELKRLRRDLLQAQVVDLHAEQGYKLPDLQAFRDSLVAQGDSLRVSLMREREDQRY